MVYLDYLDAIVRFYDFKKQEGLLPARFSNPTPANLRTECLMTFESRFNPKKDLLILENFLAVQGEAEVADNMKHLQRDRMKPLVYFLSGRTERPDDRNLELLGWVLDFPARPYNEKFDYENMQMEQGKDGPPEDANDGHNKRKKIAPPIRPEVPRESDNERQDYGERLYQFLSGYRSYSLVGLVVLIFLISFAIFYNSSGQVPPPNRTTGCMVWVDDHYEARSCDPLKDMTLVVKLDSTILLNQRRIKSSDTITSKHVRKIWYQKRGDKRYDLFTWGGRDPLDPDRDLKRLSKYICDKHL